MTVGPTAEEIRSAADLVEHRWSGAFRDPALGWNDEGKGLPCWAVVARLRSVADRLDADLTRTGGPRFSSPDPAPMR